MTKGWVVDQTKVKWDTPVPPPIIGATDVEMGDPRVPKTARRLSVRAEKAGLKVRITFARGTYQTKTTRRIVDSVAVRMRGPHTSGVGIWMDGTFDSGVIISPSRMSKVGVTDLNGWVDDHAE
jgi:hypothetical protein